MHVYDYAEIISMASRMSMLMYLYIHSMRMFIDMKFRCARIHIWICIDTHTIFYLGVVCTGYPLGVGEGVRTTIYPRGSPPDANL